MENCFNRKLLVVWNKFKSSGRLLDELLLSWLMSFMIEYGKYKLSIVFKFLFLYFVSFKISEFI